jgi:hypothetical protein
MRFIEPMYIRGPFSVMIAPILERTTEHFVLGFRWLSVMFNAYEMVDFGTRSPYRTEIRRLDVSEELVPVLIDKLSQWRPTAMILVEDVPDLNDQERHIEALRGTILGVATNIGRQMQLRHTVYYETDSVVTWTADSLAD